MIFIQWQNKDIFYFRGKLLKNSQQMFRVKNFPVSEVTIALCSNKGKRAVFMNLIVAVILNSLLLFCFPIIQGEGRRLLLMFSVFVFQWMSRNWDIIVSESKREKRSPRHHAGSIILSMNNCFY